MTQKDAVLFRITYDDYQPVDGVKGAALPRVIFFEKPNEKSDLKIKVSDDIEVNKKLPAEALLLTAPQGVELVGSCQ